MSTSPVMSITDEQLSEIEHFAYSYDIPVLFCPHDIRALLAERAELKRDAERFAWWFKMTNAASGLDVEVTLDQWRSTIDRNAAMQAAQ
jgi:hypothetical protein